jgi:hypothetical protein
MKRISYLVFLNQLEDWFCNELKEYDRAADYHLQEALLLNINYKQKEHEEAVCYNN